LPCRIFQRQNKLKRWRCTADDRGGLHEGKSGIPAVPDRTEPGPKKPVSRGQLRALDGALEHADLMTQGEDL